MSLIDGKTRISLGFAWSVGIVIITVVAASAGWVANVDSTLIKIKESIVRIEKKLGIYSEYANLEKGESW